MFYNKISFHSLYLFPQWIFPKLLSLIPIWWLRDNSRVIVYAEASQWTEKKKIVTFLKIFSLGFTVLQKCWLQIQRHWKISQIALKNSPHDFLCTILHICININIHRHINYVIKYMWLSTCTRMCRGQVLAPWEGWGELRLARLNSGLICVYFTLTSIPKLMGCVMGRTSCIITVSFSPLATPATYLNFQRLSAWLLQLCYAS